MSRELGRKRICERTDDLFAGLVVRKDSEVRAEELVRLAHRDLEREPVPGGGDRLRGDAVLRKPSIDRVNALLLRSNKLLDLSHAIIPAW